MWLIAITFLCVGLENDRANLHRAANGNSAFRKFIGLREEYICNTNEIIFFIIEVAI